MTYYADEDTGCTRATIDNPCKGEVFMRTSRSGLTVAPICTHHAAELEAALDGVAERYPEVNHPASCTCWGCSDGSY